MGSNHFNAIIPGASVHGYRAIKQHHKRNLIRRNGYYFSFIKINCYCLGYFWDTRRISDLPEFVFGVRVWGALHVPNVTFGHFLRILLLYVSRKKKSKRLFVPSGKQKKPKWIRVGCIQIAKTESIQKTTKE